MKKCKCPKEKIKSTTYHLHYSQLDNALKYTIQKNSFEAKDWAKNLNEAKDDLLLSTLDRILQLELVLEYKKGIANLGMPDTSGGVTYQTVRDVKRGIAQYNRILAAVVNLKPVKYK